MVIEHKYLALGNVFCWYQDMYPLPPTPPPKNDFPPLTTINSQDAKLTLRNYKIG